MSEQPLAGVCVYELGNSVAGPYAALVLAELGAEVIKVEAPGGDYTRGWGPPFLDNGSAAAFSGLNRNKKGIVVDLTDVAQRDNLRRDIVARADAVICNLRSGVARKFGLDSESLRVDAPQLIYCDIGAFGSVGPLSKEPGYDPLMQAAGGIMSVTGEEGERPPIRVGVSIIDMGSGLWAAIGILSALFERQRSGKGAHIETSLFETAVAWMNLHVTGYLASGEVRRPYGSGLAEIVPYQAFQTSDGWLMVAAGNDALFRKLCIGLSLDKLCEDPRCSDNATRVRNREFVVGAVQTKLRAGTTQQWQGVLGNAGVPNAPIQDIAQLLADPQVEALGIIQRAPNNGLPTVGLPLRFDGVRPSFKLNAPGLGEHTGSMLAGAAE